MTKERRAKIETYIKGLTHLYGVVDWEQFLKIANKYIKPEVTRNEIVGENYFLTGNNGYKVYEDFIQSTLASDGVIDDCYNHAEKYCRAYYTPTEKQVVERAEYDKFYETTDEHKALKGYLLGVVNDIKRVDKIMVELQKIFMTDGATRGNTLLEYLGKNGLMNFDDMEDLNKSMAFFYKASNNTRTWSNRGYSPNFVGNQMRKNRDRVLSKFADEDGWVQTGGDGSHADKPAQLAPKDRVLFYATWYKILHGINFITKTIPYFEYKGHTPPAHDM